MTAASGGWRAQRPTTSAANFLLSISPITSRVSVNVELTGSIQNFLGNWGIDSQDSSDISTLSSLPRLLRDRLQ